MQQEKLTAAPSAQRRCSHSRARLAACAPARVAPAASGEALRQSRDDLRLRHHQRRSCQTRDKWATEFSEANPGIVVDTSLSPPAPTTPQNQTLSPRARPACITLGEHPHHRRRQAMRMLRLYRSHYDPTDFGPTPSAYRWNGKTYAPRATTATKTSTTTSICWKRGPRAAAARLERHRLHLRSLPDMVQRLTKRKATALLVGLLVNRIAPMPVALTARVGAQEWAGRRHRICVADPATVEAMQFLQTHVHASLPRPT